MEEGIIRELSRLESLPTVERLKKLERNFLLMYDYVLETQLQVNKINKEKNNGNTK